MKSNKNLCTIKVIGLCETIYKIPLMYYQKHLGTVSQIKNKHIAESNDE